MAGAFMWDDKVRGSGLTAPTTAAVSTMPLSNLTDEQPRLRTRFAADNAAVLVDFGAATSIECVALISNSFDSTATIRLRLGPDSAFASPDYDSGTNAVDTSAAANGNVALLLPAAVSSRYMRLDVAQTGAALLDLGRLVAGPLWRPSRAHGYGIVEGREVLDRLDRNPFTGATFAVPAVVNPRFATFSLAVLSNAEAIGQHRSMIAALGAAGQALWIPETTLSQSELNLRSLWASVNLPGDRAGLSRDNHAGYSRSFTLAERV